MWRMWYGERQDRETALAEEQAEESKRHAAGGYLRDEM